MWTISKLHTGWWVVHEAGLILRAARTQRAIEGAFINLLDNLIVDEV